MIARAIDLSARVLILDGRSQSRRHEVEIRSQIYIAMQVSYRLHRGFPTRYETRPHRLLCNGRLIGERDTASLPRLELIRMMLGRELAETTSERAAARPHQARDVCASFEGYGKAGYLAPFDLELRHGEVVGLAGLLGSGRTETARLVFGAERADAGHAKVEGELVRLHSPRDAARLGFGYCPEERKTEGIVADLTVRENIVLALQARRGCTGRFARRAG